jgi:hypothetical protein
MNDVLVPIIAIAFSLLIPIVAIIGGITAGIIRSNARRRLIELAQRERIAAIERGIDPDKLPKLHIEPENGSLSFEQRQLRRSQALTIWGLVLTAFGLTLFFAVGMSERDYHEAAPTLMFAGVGIALLLSGRLVRPSADDLRRSPPPPHPPLG